MNAIRPDLHAAGTVAIDPSEIASSALETIRQFVAGKPKSIQSPHSERYVRRMLTGDKPMPVAFFVHLLAVVYRLGERKERGRGREWVRRVLQALARPFGLDVVPAPEERRTKDVKSETLEASIAVSRLLVSVDTATANREITREEMATIETCVLIAHREIADIHEPPNTAENTNAPPFER